VKPEKPPKPVPKRKLYRLQIHQQTDGDYTFPNIKEGYVAVDDYMVPFFESEMIEASLLPYRAKRVERTFGGYTDYWIYLPFGSHA
jgi:hypothetical protein